MIDQRVQGYPIFRETRLVDMLDAPKRTWVWGLLSKVDQAFFMGNAKSELIFSIPWKVAGKTRAHVLFDRCKIIRWLIIMLPIYCLLFI